MIGLETNVLVRYVGTSGKTMQNNRDAAKHAGLVLVGQRNKGAGKSRGIALLSVFWGAHNSVTIGQTAAPYRPPMDVHFACVAKLLYIQ